MELSLKYLKLLATNFPTVADTTTEIMNLEAILNLPKGTEHFVSDLHGEYEAFEHVLRSGSGNVRRKIEDLFQFSLSTEELDELATLIIYPEEKIEQMRPSFETTEERNAWYRQKLLYLIDVAVFSASKYTRSKVRKAIPEEYAYIIEELLFRDNAPNKADYYNEIITSMIAMDRVEEYIIAISYLIQRLVVDHLHVVGDIYDRGPYPKKILKRLKRHHSMDIQWGNHDVLWIGAASGSPVCIATVIRICSRYDNLEILEDAYGISLRRLLSFANEAYTGPIPETFQPKTDPYKEAHFTNELEEMARLQQAIAIIQFKLEKQVIDRQPNFDMADRLLLNKIDYENATINLYGTDYPLLDTEFPTINPEDPYALTEEEQEIIDCLVDAFLDSDGLQDDINFIISQGSIYLPYNGNLLFHGCMPLTEVGEFLTFEFNGKKYKGRKLFDLFDEAVRLAHQNRENDSHQDEKDLIWYLWTGKASPLFGKHAMTTFERYYIEDKETHEEIKNKYYELRDDETYVEEILREFRVDDRYGHIINGHTPVKEKNGEDPMKANRRLLVIDGGFSKAYQGRTGIGGYTLLYNSYGMELAIHKPFSSRKDTVENDKDVVSTKRVVDRELERKKVSDTDNGKYLKEQSDDMKQLLKAYREGRIKEDLI